MTTRTKAGRAGTETRRKVWLERYLVNGNNATEAALHAGYAPTAARRMGHANAHDPEISQRLAERAKQAAEAAEMTTTNWARAIRSIAFADPADLFDSAGNLLPVPQMSERIRTALSSITVDNAGKTTVKLCDKNAALVTMARHLGLFEKDNEQLAANVKVRIELVG